jgi:hypothetical protein
MKPFIVITDAAQGESIIDAAHASPKTCKIALEATTKRWESHCPNGHTKQSSVKIIMSTKGDDAAHIEEHFCCDAMKKVVYSVFDLSKQIKTGELAY